MTSTVHTTKQKSLLTSAPLLKRLSCAKPDPILGSQAWGNGGDNEIGKSSSSTASSDMSGSAPMTVTLWSRQQSTLNERPQISHVARTQPTNSQSADGYRPERRVRRNPSSPTRQATERTGLEPNANDRMDPDTTGGDKGGLRKLEKGPETQPVAGGAFGNNQAPREKPGNSGNEGSPGSPPELPPNLDEWQATSRLEKTRGRDRQARGARAGSAGRHEGASFASCASAPVGAVAATKQDDGRDEDRRAEREVGRESGGAECGRDSSPLEANGARTTRWFGSDYEERHAAETNDVRYSHRIRNRNVRKTARELVLGGATEADPIEISSEDDSPTAKRPCRPAREASSP